jgi:hypothetical protein
VKAFFVFGRRKIEAWIRNVIERGLFKTPILFVVQKPALGYVSIGERGYHSQRDYVKKIRNNNKELSHIDHYWVENVILKPHNPHAPPKVV